jgi:uncharacterized repeat protein (TIGR01451 family)
MALFSFFSRKPNQPKPYRRRVHLSLDALEERATPAAAANTISGYVYHDANNNGLFDSSETPIANVALQLKNNATNQVIASATSDATGFYQFVNDNSVSTAPTSITKTVSFPETDTNFDLSGVVDQFDPSLGVLNSIDVIHDGSVTSSLLVENTSRASGSTITGTVSGNLNLIAPGVNDVLTMSQNAGSVTVAKFDNTLDFGGLSGANLGTKTATGNKTITLTGSALNGWQGTGKVTVQEIGTATSNANGGGNVTAAITSSGRSTITVRYNYTPGNGLQPGAYTIIETQPAGYLDGKDALGGVPIPNSIGTDTIALTLANMSLTNNNFGELQSASLSGYVYVDANDNGVKEAEQPIGGVTITLSGFTADGPVSQTATTDASGFYQFSNLKPGTYGLQEGNPGSQYLDGKDTVGSQGGTVVNDNFSSIELGSGANGINYNFGEVLPGKLSGYVYVDANENGIKEGEQPIAGVTITLTGFTTDGPVTQTATTDASGFYQFSNLKAGAYGLQEGDPGSQYLDGKDTVGSQGGSTVGNDNFTSITLEAGVNGVNNNFGEVLPGRLSGTVYLDANENGVLDAEESGIGNVTVTLAGVDSSGSVSRTATTDASGAYQFTNLRPGTYSLAETQPSNFKDGQESLGTTGGAVGPDLFTSIALAMGTNGERYNFGELRADDSDVGIVKAASATQSNVGDTLTYTLTITNFGPYLAKDVSVVDTIPIGATLLSATGPGWAIFADAGKFTATLPSLAVGLSTAITVQIRVPGVSSTITNTAIVSTSSPDKNPTNNTSTVTTAVIIPPPGTTGLVGTPTTLASKGGFTTNTVVQWAEEGKNAAFVSGLYQTVLNRLPDPSGNGYFLGLLAKGASTAQVTSMLWTSDEHRGIQADQIYRSVLGRAPSASERAGAAGALKAGASEAAVARQLYTSAEYLSLHPGTVNLAGSLHVSVTGALPSAAQSSAMLQAMDNSPLDQVVAAIQQSDDGLRNIVREAYRVVLRRSAADGDIDYWFGRLKFGGLSQGDLFQAFLNSEEFKSLANRAAIR